MLYTNYILLIPSLFAFFAASYINFRIPDLKNRISAQIILYTTGILIINYMLFTQNMFAETAEIWLLLFLISYIFFNLYFVFYIVHSTVKRIGILLSIPVAVLIVSFILGFILFNRTLVPGTLAEIMLNNLFYVRNNVLLTIGFWSLSLILTLIRKKFYLMIAVFIILISNILLLFKVDFYIFNIIVNVYQFYLPAAIILDIRNMHPFYFKFDTSEVNVINNVDIAIAVLRSDSSFMLNAYLLRMLERDGTDPGKWVKSNYKRIIECPDNVFKKVRLLGNSKKYYYVWRQDTGTFRNDNHTVFMFAADRYENLRKISFTYENYLEEKNRNNIVKFSDYERLNEYIKFIEGFSHNSFNLISVVTTGFQYMKSILNEFEIILFSSGSLEDKRDDLKKVFYNTENTVEIAEKSERRLMNNMKKLRNKTKLESKDEPSVFQLNQFVEQEVFFYIDNIFLNSFINVEYDLMENDIDLHFEYAKLASVFHNLLKFIMSKTDSRIKRHIITLKTEYERLSYAKIILRTNINDFDKMTINGIFEESGFNASEFYSTLINAHILMKSCSGSINLLDEDSLGFEIIIYE
ncbi:MAG: hypothetical protein SVK54_08895 [candidate division WOR-3 bacterium]|nr:hypothetical protein [candidate division WOR-3 bacterium]